MATENIGFGNLKKILTFNVKDMIFVNFFNENHDCRGIYHYAKLDGQRLTSSGGVESKRNH